MCREYHIPPKEIVRIHRIFFDRMEHIDAVVAQALTEEHRRTRARANALKQDRSPFMGGGTSCGLSSPPP